MVLFAVKTKRKWIDAENATTDILLNPGRAYHFASGDVCVYLAEDFATVKELRSLPSDTQNLLREFLESKAPMKVPRGVPLIHIADQLTVGQTNTNPLPNNWKAGIPEQPYEDAGCASCWLLQEATNVNNTKLQDVRMLNDKHIVVSAGSYNLFFFVAVLRGAHIPQSQISPIVIVHTSPPSDIEWELFSQFPEVFYVLADLRDLKDMHRLRVENCEAMVLFAAPRDIASEDDNGASDIPLM